jgi:hypothetical protein
MKREEISLGTKEQRRAFVFNQLLSRVVDVGEAAQLVGLSPRQIKAAQGQVSGARARGAGTLEGPAARQSPASDRNAGRARRALPARLTVRRILLRYPSQHHWR